MNDTLEPADFEDRYILAAEQVNMTGRASARAAGSTDPDEIIISDDDIHDAVSAWTTSTFDVSDLGAEAGPIVDDGDYRELSNRIYALLEQAGGTT